MKTRAAVLVELGAPLVMADLEIPDLKPGQVLVKVAFSGVCHTQLLESEGHRGPDAFLPHCLGHEGSGIVEGVGAGVKKVATGDRVILSWIKGSGADVPAAAYRWNDRVVNAGGITTWSDYAVISENRLTPVPAETPLREAALLGCAVPTGLGVVFNTLQVGPGTTIAVFGSGGIGLCAIAAAAIAGCARIIAVDVSPERLRIAGEMGATDLLAAGDVDPVAEIGRLCKGGVDFAVEASGRPSAMVQALASVRNQGGAAAVVGNARFGEHIELDPKQFNLGKRLLGTWGGDNMPDRDFPKYVALLADGRLNLSPLRGPTYPLERVNDALADMKSGRAARPIMEMGPG